MRNGASTGLDFHWMMSQAFLSGVGLEQHTLVLTWQLFINYGGRFLSYVPHSCNSLASNVGRRVGSLLFQDISHNKPEPDMTFLSLLYLYWYFFYFLTFWSFRKKWSTNILPPIYFRHGSDFRLEPHFYQTFDSCLSCHLHTSTQDVVVTLWPECGTISKQTEEVGYMYFISFIYFKMGDSSLCW